MEHYSAIEIKELLIYATTPGNPQGNMLSENPISNPKILHTVRFHLYDIFGTTKTQKQRTDGWLSRAQRGSRREMGIVIKGKPQNSCGDRTVQYLDCHGRYSNLHM